MKNKVDFNQYFNCVIRLLLINGEEMDSVITFDILKKVKEQKNAVYYGDEIVMLELNGSNSKEINRGRFRYNEKVQFSALTIVLMLNGEVDIKINGNNFNLKSKAILDIFDMHIVQNLKVSSDFGGYCLIISKSFIQEAMHGVKKIPISNFFNRIENPIEDITNDEAALLEEIYLRIMNNISRNEHYAQRDIIKNELRSLLMEFLNIITHKSRVKVDNILNNKEDIIGRFMRLVAIHCKEHHNVEFYSNELCIESKYLSRILKSLNGNTASKWIDDNIMKEAKIHLQDKSLTIQQVSDILNFSDQSAFGKFFKKHSGMSPLKYKNSF